MVPCKPWPAAAAPQDCCVRQALFAAHMALQRLHIMVMLSRQALHVAGSAVPLQDSMLVCCTGAFWVALNAV